MLEPLPCCVVARKEQGLGKITDRGRGGRYLDGGVWAEVGRSGTKSMLSLSETSGCAWAAVPDPAEHQ